MNRPDVLRVAMMMISPVIAGLCDIECAKAASVVQCEPVSLSQANKAQVEELAKNLLAPQPIDHSRNISCRQREKVIALFQSIPALATDGALETRFAICHREQGWECDVAVERAVDVAEPDRSATVRITTRDDLSADQLRALYAAAVGPGLTSAEPAPACRTSAEDARNLRALFLQSSSKEVKASRDGELFGVERDHIEITFSIEEGADGVKAMQYRCITRWLQDRRTVRTDP
jgi:hypothetical protein